MKLLKNTQRIALLSVVTVCLICLFSCKTTAGAAKGKENSSSSAETANTKVASYHAMAKAVTEQCPMELDEATTLMKLDYKEDQHAFEYTYLFSGSVYEEMDAQDRAVAQKTAEDMLKEKLTTHQLVSQIQADNLTLIYVYKDKNGKVLFTVTLEPDKY